MVSVLIVFFCLFRYRTFGRCIKVLRPPSESSLQGFIEDAYAGFISIRANHAHRPVQAPNPSPGNLNRKLADWKNAESQGSFFERFDACMERSTTSIYLELSLTRWLDIRLSFIAAIFVTTFALAVVCMPELNKAAYAEFHFDDDKYDSTDNESGKSSWGLQLDTILVALALAYSLSLLPVLHNMIDDCIDFETNLNAFNRVSEVANLAPEGQAVKAGDPSSDAGLGGTRLLVNGVAKNGGSGDAAFARQTHWQRSIVVGARANPRLGSVKFENIVARYRVNLPPVLSGVSFSMLPGSLVGVLGRARSGKSTLCSVLLRLLDPEQGGRVMMDTILRSRSFGSKSSSIYEILLIYLVMVE